MANSRTMALRLFADMDQYLEHETYEEIRTGPSFLSEFLYIEIDYTRLPFVADLHANSHRKANYGQ